MSDIHELIELVSEQQQRLQYQVLFSNAVLAELVEEISYHFDEIYFRLKALERRRWWHRFLHPFTRFFSQANALDELIRQEKIRHVKKLTLTLSKSLHRLEEKQAQYGSLDSPVHLDIQIDEYREKLADVAEQLRWLLD